MRTSMRGALSGRVAALIALAVLGTIEPATARAEATPAEVAAAAIADACPCAGPLLGGSWRNHSEYVSCAYGVARDLARRGEVRQREGAPAVKAALANACGRTVRGTPPNAELCTDPGLVVSCDVLRSAHADSCEECDAALAGDLVRCARAVDTRGSEHRDCASPTTGRFPRRGRVVEVRFAADCGSCLDKLGTEQSEGVACLAVDCPPAF
jgi:hypothetical protein